MNNTVIYFLDECGRLGGATNTLLRQAFLLKRCGYNIILCRAYSNNQQMGDAFVQICQSEQVSIVSLPYKCKSHTEEIDLEFLFKGYKEIKEFVEGYKPIILHSVQINVAVEMVSRELKIPHIMNVYPALNAFFNIKYLNVFPHYHICDSWYYAEKWKNGLNIESTCIRTYADRIVHVVKNSISSRQDYPVNYICVGQIYKEKNQLGVIKAFEKAISLGIKGTLSIYGNDNSEYARECNQYIEEHDLKQYINVKGFCCDMAPEYEKADVLICGSTRESYPNVISEALANQLIIITTPVAGVPEIITDKMNGYVTDDYSDVAIFNKIKQFDEDRRNRKLSNIYININKSYEKYHTAKSVMEQLLNYYNWVLEDYREFGKNKCIQMDELKNLFGDILLDFQISKEKFMRPEMAYNKLWYIYHIQPIVSEISPNKKAYIWGAGRLSFPMTQIIEHYFPTVVIEGYIDSFAEKCNEKNVVRPDEVLNEDIIIFIGTTVAQHDILDELKKYGKVCNRDYFLMVPRYW